MFLIHDVDNEIEVLRRKVENEAKRKKVEDDLRKKKRNQNRINAVNASMNPGSKPYTMDGEGKVLVVKTIKTNKLPNNECSHATQVKLDDKNVKYDKIKGLEHLYMIPAGADVKTRIPEVKMPHENEENHVQEITALQPPPSEVLTLKAGVILNENGNIINGPEPDYQARMSKDQYYSKLGSQSMQRK